MGGEGHCLGRMNSVFSEQILADKLSKLNSTQQCIESILSFFLTILIMIMIMIIILNLLFVSLHSVLNSIYS